jgi:hypothetical protein
MRFWPDDLGHFVGGPLGSFVQNRHEILLGVPLGQLIVDQTNHGQLITDQLITDGQQIKRVVSSLR